MMKAVDHTSILFFYAFDYTVLGFSLADFGLGLTRLG